MTVWTPGIGERWPISVGRLPESEHRPRSLWSMRRISHALRELVDEVNGRGVTVRGRELTPTQVSDLQDRWVISTEEWSHPGRPRGGSWIRYPPSAIATIEAVAKGLNEKRDTNRAFSWPSPTAQRWSTPAFALLTPPTSVDSGKPCNSSPSGEASPPTLRGTACAPGLLEQACPG